MKQREQQKRRVACRWMAAGVAATMALQCFAWSQKGHDVTAYIAEQHLTPATQAAVDSIFEGKSLVYWANWLDNASHTNEYGYTRTWHYINVDEGQDYDTMQQQPNGDAVTAVRYVIAQLSDTLTTPEQKQLALKILTHVMGDLHQPMHTGHASDLGGNRIKVKFFGDEKNLHSVWDGSILESSHRWSYSEWQQQLDRLSEAQQALVISGNIDDWTKQSLAVAADIYKFFPAGKNISYGEVAYWAPTIEDQLLKGGLRLAHVLNLIFDPDYRPGSLTATDL